MFAGYDKQEDEDPLARLPFNIQHVKSNVTFLSLQGYTP